MTHDSGVLRSGRVIRWIPMIILIGASAYLLIGTMTLRPIRMGDGCEYAQMTESFVNHLSPDGRPHDLASLSEWCPGFRLDATPPYYLGTDGRRYSYHFWAYSLVAVPVKLALRALGTNELRAFQIVNALLLIAALSCVVFLLPWDVVWRVFLGLLSLIGPTLWFVPWPHPEVYSFALVTMALVFVTRSAWPISAGLAGLASWQNSPLAALVVLIIVKGFRDRTSRTRKILLIVAGVGTTTIPYVYSLIKLGTPSLLAKHTAAREQITVTRVVELFIDPNIGIGVYTPVVLVLFFGVVVRDVLVRRQLSFAFEMFTIVVAMAVAAASTLNWNSDTAGPIRYAVWMLPLLLFGVVESATRARSSRERRVCLAVLGAGVISQAAILSAASGQGGFISRLDFLDHTGLAKLVLRTVPSLYNPSPELFTERTVHREFTDYFAVFFDRQRCRKALLRPDDRDLLEAVCGALPPAVEAALASAHGIAPVYVTFPKRTPPAPPGAREAAAGELSVADWLSRGARRPATTISPRVTLTVNQPMFTRGSVVRLGLRIEPLSRAGPADLYVGIVDVWARVATLRSTGGLTVRSRFVGLVPSMRTRAIDLDHGKNTPALLELVAGRDLPAGTYEAYAVVVSRRAVPGTAVSADDVISADIKTFRVED